MNWSERVKGAVLGHAAGDALGVPVEFIDRERFRSEPVTDMDGYGTHNQPPGTWSDDTSLMLCLLESLKNKVDLDGIARKFVAWRDEAYWTPHGSVFDIGITTDRAISRLKKGVPALEAGEDGERGNGNGSLMRILPVAFLKDLSDADLTRTAHQVSCLTHRHPRSQMACGVFVLVCRRLLNGASPMEAYVDTVKIGAKLYQNPPFKMELRHFERFFSGHLADFKEEDIQSSGYVIHTFEASIWCLLNTASFNDAVLMAVNLGGDTDTTGAVTGGLAGATYGLSSIPEKWLTCLARRTEIEKLVEGLIKTLD